MCFIGYAPNKKGYKCFNPKTRKHIISMDVTFLEHQPYFQKKFLKGGETKRIRKFLGCYFHSTKNCGLQKPFF